MFLKTAFTTFLLSLSLSVDDLAVGVAYGLRRIRIRPLPLVVMLMGSTIAMTAAMDLAKIATAPLGATLSKYLSAGLLTALGCWTLYKAWGKCDDASETGKVEKNPVSGELSLWESFYLGLALGVDDFAEAAGLAVAGFSIWLTVAMFKLSELIAILVGSALGFHGVTKILRCRLRLIPGFVLIAVGLWQLV